MRSDLEEIRWIRRRLGPVWDAFFARFGRLTPIQLEALPLLVQREDAVLTSPTASGKTEAVLAPAVRHMLDRSPDGEGPSLLYISPTRALVADLARRFGPLLAELGITAAFRTSDTPYLPSSFPRALFTTPESLDSLICRRPAAWREVRTIVLDELHLLDGTCRGDQLRVLLMRLRLDHVASVPHQVILSATIPDPAAMAARYVGTAHAVGSGAPRTIRLTVVRTLAEALKTCREARRFKVLAFCNSRKECEQAADRTSSERLWPRDAVFVHHASLSARTRRMAEANFREATAAVCFATTTLELGIDIGDVSAAVLCGPPPDVSSFVQRLGRACRREREIFAIGIALTDTDAERFATLERLGSHETLEPPPYLPDFSVVVQQTFSMLYAHPEGLSPAWLAQRCEPISPAEVTLDILAWLTRKDWLRREGGILGGRVFATERVMDLGERGTVHTNLADERTRPVYDAGTGELLGEIPWSADPGAAILLAGRRWTVARTSGRGVLVTPGGAGDAATRFALRRRLGKFFNLLPPDIQEEMRVAREETGPDGDADTDGDTDAEQARHPHLRLVPDRDPEPDGE